MVSWYHDDGADNAGYGDGNDRECCGGSRLGAPHVIPTKTLSDRQARQIRALRSQEVDSRAPGSQSTAGYIVCV